MKIRLFVSVIVSMAALCPLNVDAAEFAKVRKFGGFSAGKTFSLKVVKVTSTKQTDNKLPVKSPIPKGLPDLKKGRTVKFKIGKKGQLAGPGFSYAFESGGEVSNGYAHVPKDGTPRVETALVFKSAKGQPKKAMLTFFKWKAGGPGGTTWQVDYVLN